MSIMPRAFLEPAKNINTELQAIGRIHRLGQEHPQRVWILFTDHSYDRSRQYSNIKKMIQQIAAGNSTSIANKVGHDVESAG